MEDVVEGIWITLQVSDKLHVLDREEEAVLRRLLKKFEAYPNYSGFPNQTLTENEIKAYEQLGRQLVDAGWAGGVSFTSSWDEMLEKAGQLMAPPVQEIF